MTIKLKTFLKGIFIILMTSCNSDNNTLDNTPVLVSKVLFYINANVESEEIITEIKNGTENIYEARVSYLVKTNTNGDCINYNYEGILKPIETTNLPEFR